MKRYLYQNIENLVGMNKEQVAELKLAKEEFWSASEIAMVNNLLYENKEIGNAVRDLLWNGENDIPAIVDLIRFINSKRAFKFNWNGEIRAIGIPKVEVGDTLNAFSRTLLNIAITYMNWKNCSDEEDKKSLWDKFLNLTNSLRIDIAKRFLSKNFKEKYQFKMIGYSSVALPGHLGIDEVALPEHYCLKNNISIGDLCIVKRDPVQNIFLCLKVAKMHYANIIRVNPRTIQLVDGDFDGDNIAVIPFRQVIMHNKFFFYENKELKIDLTNKIKEELLELLPSKIMKNESLTNLTREYVEGFPLGEMEKVNITKIKDILNASKKSKKYLADLPDYMQSHIETVKNMITVKEGTATAGSFCNWIMEVARNAGLDMVTARALSNRLQRVALDSKHEGGKGSYKDLPWYKLATLCNQRRKFYSVDEIYGVIESIINEDMIELTSDDEDEDIL